ncbi:LysR family transcriptional regulator [Enterobacteriaceae bacterium C23F]
MDKRQLTAFIRVFEERNITRAAQQLSLTQPALSATIKALEEELSISLFIRKSRGVDVTEDARVLYPHARRMIDDMSGLVSRFRKRQDKLPLHIGIEEDIASSFLTDLLAKTSQDTSGMLLTLLPGCTGDVRLGCDNLRCEDELFFPLYEESYVLAYPVGHELGQTEELLPEELHHQTWVMAPEHESHQRFLPFYGHSADKPGAHAGNFSLALDLVEAGFGITIAPDCLVQSRCALASRPLPGYPMMRRIGICYAAQSLANPAVEQLLDSLGK